MPSSLARSAGLPTFQRPALAKEYYYVEGDSDGEEEAAAPAVRPWEPDAATRTAPSTRRLRRARPATIPMRRCHSSIESKWDTVLVSSQATKARVRAGSGSATCLDYLSTCHLYELYLHTFTLRPALCCMVAEISNTDFGLSDRSIYNHVFLCLEGG